MTDESKQKPLKQKSTLGREVGAKSARSLSVA